MRGCGCCGHDEPEKPWTAPFDRIDLLLVAGGRFHFHGNPAGLAPEDDDLFGLGTLSFIAASVGRQARRQRWRNWARFHIAGMGLSYVFLITAFYVDNGKSLPLWRDLPQVTFWIFPSAVGLPIILYALQRHPIMRQKT